MKSIRPCLGAFGLLVAATIIGCGDGAVRETASSTGSSGPAGYQADVRQARAAFQTQWFRPPGDALPAPAPPDDENLELINYTSPAGQLAAYITPDPGDGKQHAAVLWAHSRRHGLSDVFWQPESEINDQSARAFRDAGLVMMIPSFRGDNDNPGQCENGFGEVDDFLAAREHLASLPYVDRDRIYAAGHNNGGTIVMSAVECTDEFRAAFVFAGSLDERATVKRLQREGPPLGAMEDREYRFRSPLEFVHAISTPTFYLVGNLSSVLPDVFRLETKLGELSANGTRPPLTVCTLPGGTQFDILSPMTAWAAETIVADDGPECEIEVNPAAVSAYFEPKLAEMYELRAQAVAHLPIVELTPEAFEVIKNGMEHRLSLIDENRRETREEIQRLADEGNREAQRELANLNSQEQEETQAYLFLNRWDVWAVYFYYEHNSESQLLIEQDGIKIIVPKNSLDRVRGHTMDYAYVDGQYQYVFEDQLAPKDDRR